MNLNEMQALVEVGRLGMALAASRVVSLVLGFGACALAGYVIYSPSWQGVAVVFIVSGCGLYPALRLEVGRKPNTPTSE